MINLSVIVPYFNEENLLKKSVNRLLENNIFEDIILIDNNSTDSSLNIAKKLASNNKNIFSFKSDGRKGKGTALNYAREHITTSHVIVHDADLEYFPDDIFEMFEVSKHYPNSMILGSRFIGTKERKNVYLRTHIANRFMSIVFSAINFYNVSDIATCYKLMPSDFFKKTNFREHGFAIDIEILSKFLKFNRSIKEVPIKYEGRSYSEGKKIKTIDGFKWLLGIIKYRFIN